MSGEKSSLIYMIETALASDAYEIFDSDVGEGYITVINEETGNCWYIKIDQTRLD